MPSIKWKDAIAQPLSEWSNAGTYTKIYGECHELLKRLQKAYHAYYGGKRPSLTQMLTYALCECSYAITRKCQDFESKVQAREAMAAKSAEADPNSLISKPVE